MSTTETWTGTDGATWPAQWTTTNSATIQGNQGRLVTGASFGANATGLCTGMTAVATADLIVDVQPTVAGTAANAEVSVLASGGTNGVWPTTGYSLKLGWNAAGNVSLNLYKWVSNGSTGLGANNKTVGFVDPWRVRLQVDGTGNIKAKFWLASGAEPGTWDITATDATPLGAGRIYLATETIGSVAVGMNFDNLADSAGASLALTNTVAPAVTPTSSVTTGTVLTSTNGTWSATPDSYTYQWNRAGVAISGATAATYTVVSADLSNAITCTVTAIKATYTSGTATSNAVTPTAANTVPGAPTSLTATPANVSAALSWTAPASNGGAAITDYTIQYRTTAGPGAWTTYTHAAQTTTTMTVTGLTNGTGYDFQVAAVNSVGTGSYSATASATPAQTSFAPNDTNIVYSPYNWNVTGTAAQTASSGAYLRFTVTTGSTSTLTANFDTTGATGTQQVAIRIDNAPAVFANVTSTVTINLAGSGSGWNVHTVELEFRWLTGTDLWTAPTGGVKFTGITASTAISTRTMRRRPLNILCYGDSIANGYLAGPGQSDTRYGWAYPLAALLGAEVGIAAYTGQGWLNTGNGNVPAFTTTYNGLWSGQARTFTSPAEPALVLINMGTNDSADVTTAATTVLNGILAATTTAKIVLIQQWNGTAHKTQLQAAAAACSAPSRVTYLDTTGWLNSADTVDGTHPIGYINLADLSPRIAASVESLIAGAPVTPKRFVNVGGTAKAIG